MFAAILWTFDLFSDSQFLQVWNPANSKITPGVFNYEYADDIVFLFSFTSGFLHLTVFSAIEAWTSILSRKPQYKDIYRRTIEMP